MNVFTYFTALPQLDVFAEKRLMLAWEMSWRNQGFTPYVLNEWHALQHPLYEAYDKAVSAFPSINPAGYDRACFLRWLALANAPNIFAGEIIMMTDYDVMCYAKADHWPVLPQLVASKTKSKKAEARWIKSVLGFQWHVPAVVVGTPGMFVDQCRKFMAYQVPEGTTHLSDQLICSALREAGQFDNEQIVKSYGEVGWEKAPAVHYPNAAMHGKQPRWKFVEALR